MVDLKMYWLLVVLGILLLWVVSLCKVFYCSHMMSKAASSFNGPRNNGKRKNILLVVAHPDDESMFFSPTILFFISEGHNVHILCMSAGNAEGKGDVRREELYRACAILKVSLQQIKVLDHPDFQDGFNNPWNHQLLATIIQQEIQMHNINFIITFDNYGVSGHPNHRDVHHGLCMLLRGISSTNIEAWELVSTSIPRKYSGPVDIWLSKLFTSYYHRGLAYCFSNSSPRKTYLAMAEHDSQWVWFRRLFVLFSSYTYVNTLRKIK